jgi:glycosyltransferase involved in cell wall biosynthesis
LTGYRGGEKVLEVLCELFPEADVYTMIHKPGATAARIEERRIVPSWLNRLPGSHTHYRYLLPLMPSAARRLKVSGYDLVVATNHCVAHGVDASKSHRLISYCFTPMRYAWGMLDAYFTRQTGGDPRRVLLKLFGGYLRRWDRTASRRVNAFIATCRNIRTRIRRCYDRDARIIYPPVDTETYHPTGAPREAYYLWVGALAPYKRIDLAVDAVRRLGRELVVIGEGQDAAWVRKQGGSHVRFLGRQPDEVLLHHYNRCRALLFPGEEDFGIVPVEAQACGCPVIAFGRGGALETVVDMDANGAPPTGLHFHEAEAESLAEAILRFERHADRFDPGAIRVNAERFGTARCKEALTTFLCGGLEGGGLC